MEMYHNRTQAGSILAENLHRYRENDEVIVLALPRGGVPVAYEVAKALDVPLEVFIVRKLGVPGHQELAMGAIALEGPPVFNRQIIDNLKVEASEIENVIARETAELQRRQQAYRGQRPFPSLKNKIIILVDDGIATGATMRAAVLALKRLEPAEIIVAVPVASPDSLQVLETLVDTVVCPLKPDYLNSVGEWYEDFSQTEDAEVFHLLAQARKEEAK